MTNLGKDICKHLKAIRRQIAQENDIALDIPECTYKGDCSGTCPRCESELQYLESELTRRSSFGKAALVAGVAFTMATSPVVMAQERTDLSKTNEQQVRRGKCQLRGQVVDVNGEPLISANVVLKQQGHFVAGAKTNNEGAFEIKNIKRGTYELSVSYIGYSTADTTIEIRKTTFVKQTLVNDIESLQGIIPVVVGKPAPPDDFGVPTKCDSAASKGMPTIETGTSSGSDGSGKITSEDLRSFPSSMSVVKDALNEPKNDLDVGEPVGPYIGYIQVRLGGTPASTPAEPQSSCSQNNDNVNPLDKEAR